MNNNYYQKYLKYKNKYLLLKNQMKGGAYTTSLCVDNAYHQHDGECWHDAISMILHFSDDIKDIIQPQLYNKLSEDEIKMKQKNDLFLPIDLDHDKIDIYYTNVTKYLESLSERFINHYDNDKFFNIWNGVGNYEKYEELEKIKKIPLKTQSTLTREKSIQYGVESAVCISQIFNDPSSYPTDIYKDHGNGNSDYLNIVNIYNQFFLFSYKKYITMLVFPFGYENIFKLFYTNEYLKYLYDNSFAMTMGVRNARYSSLHEVSIFKCNKQFYYYDDNIGIFSIDITNFIECINTINLDTEYLVIKYNYIADSNNKYRKLTIVQFLNINKNDPGLENIYMHIIFDIVFYHLNDKIDENYIKYQNLNSHLNVIFTRNYLSSNYDIEHYLNVNAEIDESYNIDYYISIYKDDIKPIIDKFNKIKTYNYKICYETAIKISKDKYDLYYVLLGYLTSNYYKNFDNPTKARSMLYSREYPPDNFLLSLCNNK